MSVTVPTMTGYSAFWNLTGDAVPYATLSRTYQGWRSKLEWQLARLFEQNETREIKELLLTLLGTAAGSTALSQYKRVQPPASTSATTPTPTAIGELGGNVPIETVTVINRATTAADITYLTSILDGTMNLGSGVAITYVNDLSGVGASSRTSDILQ